MHPHRASDRLLGCANWNENNYNGHPRHFAAQLQCLPVISLTISLWYHLKAFRPLQNGQHFTDDVFLNENHCILIHWRLHLWYNWQIFVIGSGNCLAPNKPHPITWTNDDVAHWPRMLAHSCSARNCILISLCIYLIRCNKDPTFSSISYLICVIIFFKWPKTCGMVYLWHMSS